MSNNVSIIWLQMRMVLEGKTLESYLINLNEKHRYDVRHLDLITL